jgi:O-antigen/teichoic acid export membrane protein
MSVLTDMGLTTTIAQRLAQVWPSKLVIAQQRSRTFFWTRVGLVIFAALVGLVFAQPFSRIILRQTTQEAALWWQLTMIGVTATVISGSVTALLRASRQFRSISFVFITNAVITAVFAIILFLRNQLTLTTALLILGVVPSLFSFVVAYKLLPYPLDLRLPNRLVFRQEQKELFRFSRWIGLSNILVAITAQMDVILLSRWWSGTTISFYFLALNLVTKLEIVNHSLYTVLVPTVSALQNRAEMRHYIYANIKRSLFLIILLLPALFLIDPFIGLFYGADFQPAGSLFRWLCLLFAFDVMTLPIILLIFPLQQPKLLAATDALRTFIFIGLSAWLIPIYGPVGVIVAKGAAKVLGFLLTVLALYLFSAFQVPAQKNVPNE